MSVIVFITLEDVERQDYEVKTKSRLFCNGAFSKIRLSMCMSRSTIDIQADDINTNMATRKRVGQELLLQNDVPDSNNVYNNSVKDTKELLGSEMYKGSTRNAIMTIAAVFIASLLMLGWLYMSFPALEESEKKYVKLPRDMNEAKHIGRILDRYKERYYIEVVALVFVTYIFLQTFAIPGSISLSILSGFLFPFPFALALVCFCSATGASLCYLISSLVGRSIVHKYFPERAAQWATTVKKHEDSILNYIIFLRITPFLPNWFINIASPCLDVPLFPFWLGTLLGVAPPSVLAIQAGQTLHQMSSSDASWSWTSVVILAGCAIFSVIPVFFKNKLRRKFE